MNLITPDGYPDDDVECNGCGAANGLSRFFVPNTLYGLSVKEACDIHDYCYAVGTTGASKEAADEMFLVNMLTLIQEGSCWLRWLRERRAFKYYYAVKLFGYSAFWNNKVEN